jgi:outer membrane protein
MNCIKYMFGAFALTVSFTSIGQKQLSVEQAITNALQYNFDIQISRNAEEIAGKNNSWSEAGLFPTVSLVVGQGNSIQDNRDNPFSFTKGVIANSSLTPSLQANVNLFNGFQVKMSKQRLEQMEEQSKGNTSLLIEILIRDILKMYFTAVLQKERSLFFQTSLNFSRRRMLYSSIKNEYSANNSLELMQLKNQYLSDSTNYLLQKMSYENSVRNLLLLINNPTDSEETELPELTDDLTLPLELIDLESLKSHMISNNQNLKNQFLQSQLQQTNIDFQRSFLYPTFNLQLNASPSYGYFQQLIGGDPNGPQSLNTQSIAYGANFSLRYNLYNNWKGKRAVEIAKIQSENGELTLEKLKNSLQTNLTNLYRLYEIRTSLLNVSTENIQYAEKAFNLGQNRFEMGSLNSINLQTLQNNYQNTKMQHLENLYNRLETYIDLYQLSGKLTLEYQK